MKINLFTSFYKDKNEDRARELLMCLDMNLYVGYDSINIISDTEEESHFALKYVEQNAIISICKKFDFNYLDRRPNFNDFFELMDKEQFNGDINVLCNSDIYIRDLNRVKDFMSQFIGKKTCLALSRWDVQGLGEPIHFMMADSQDTWVFLGNPKFHTETDYGMGIAGCDNKLAYELEQGGFEVLNPSCSVKTYHHHLSNVRNYIKGDVVDRVPPPYKLVTPY
jgi:hypothetical protein